MGCENVYRFVTVFELSCLVRSFLIQGILMSFADGASAGRGLSFLRAIVHLSVNFFRGVECLECYRRAFRSEYCGSMVQEQLKFDKRDYFCS